MPDSKSFQNKDWDFAAKHFRRVLNKKPTPQLLSPQEHHDLYVKKYKESLASGIYLSEAEFIEYQRAIAREKAGQVKP